MRKSFLLFVHIMYVHACMHACMYVILYFCECIMYLCCVRLLYMYV